MPHNINLEQYKLWYCAAGTLLGNCMLACSIYISHGQNMQQEGRMGRPQLGQAKKWLELSAKEIRGSFAHINSGPRIGLSYFFAAFFSFVTLLF